MTRTTRSGAVIVAMLAAAALLVTMVTDSGPVATDDRAIAALQAQEDADADADSDPIADLFGDGQAAVTDGVSVTLSRDPFFPVITGLTDDTGGDGAGDGGTDAGGDGGLDGGADGGNGGTGDGGTGDGGSVGALCSDPSGTEAVCEGVVVSLSGFDESGRALISVGGITEAGAEGDLVGAGLVEILSIDPPFVQLRYGDEAFVLGIGEQVLK